VRLAAISLAFAAILPAAQQEKPAATYLFPAKGVDEALLRSDARVAVAESPECWTLTPAAGAADTALLFFPGGGVDPKAYFPLLRAVVAEGFTVHLVKVTLEFGSADAHRRKAVDRGRIVMAARPGVRRWFVAGHSMGGAIAAQFVHEDAKLFCGLALIATTHPREHDLSRFALDVTKIVGTLDLVARLEQCEAGRALLPAATTWVRVEGGNHAQFGSYGSQPGDGAATISADEQRAIASDALLAALRRVAR
jgi:pimeloyl-ACP methyl ester carboxylesterase